MTTVQQSSCQSLPAMGQIQGRPLKDGHLGFGCATAALLGFGWTMFSLSECIPAARELLRVSPICIAEKALHKSTRDHGCAPLFIQGWLSSEHVAVRSPTPRFVPETANAVNKTCAGSTRMWKPTDLSKCSIAKTISTAHRSKDMGGRSSEPGANRWTGTRLQAYRCRLSGCGNRHPNIPLRLL